MAKHLLSFLFVFLMLSSFSFAGKDDKIQSEFGKDLTNAPFFLRFSFSQQYKKDWDKSDYQERRDFLKGYESTLDAEQAKEKADAKAAAIKEKERIFEKKAELRRERDKLKAEAAEKRAEEKAEKDRQKQFNAAVKEQQKELKDLQKEEKRGGGLMSDQGADQGAADQGTADQGTVQGPAQGAY